MAHLNVEIKARHPDPGRVREALRARGADFRGLDHQIDTYFKCARGRLKLREGNIENSLIQYDRPNVAGPKDAQVELLRLEKGATLESLKAILMKSQEVLVAVDKRREIYFIGNVKFHIDEVEGLGSFVEIEAIDAEGTIGRDRLLAQCEEYIALFGLRAGDMVTHSYSDLLMAARSGKP